ncbi:hypothetical protein PHYBOEH_004842, partial [Phytophthora boehmeriae]
MAPLTQQTSDNDLAIVVYDGARTVNLPHLSISAVAATSAVAVTSAVAATSTVPSIPAVAAIPLAVSIPAIASVLDAVCHA